MARKSTYRKLCVYVCASKCGKESEMEMASRNESRVWAIETNWNIIFYWSTVLKWKQLLSARARRFRFLSPIFPILPLFIIYFYSVGSHHKTRTPVTGFDANKEFTAPDMHVSWVFDYKSLFNCIFIENNKCSHKWFENKLTKFCGYEMQTCLTDSDKIHIYLERKKFHRLNQNVEFTFWLVFFLNLYFSLFLNIVQIQSLNIRPRTKF